MGLGAFVCISPGRHLALRLHREHALLPSFSHLWTLATCSLNPDRLQRLQGVCVPRLLARDLQVDGCLYQLVTEYISGGCTLEKLMAGGGPPGLQNLGSAAEAVSVLRHRRTAM